MQSISVTQCGRQHLCRQQMSDKTVSLSPAAIVAGFQDLGDFERDVIVGARETGDSIFELDRKREFSRTTISVVYHKYQVLGKA